MLFENSFKIEKVKKSIKHATYFSHFYSYLGDSNYNAYKLVNRAVK